VTRTGNSLRVAVLGAALVAAACGQHVGVHERGIEARAASDSEPLAKSRERANADGLRTGETRSFDSGSFDPGTAYAKAGATGGGTAGGGGGGGSGKLPPNHRVVTISGDGSSQIAGQDGRVVDLNSDGIPDQGQLIIRVVGDGPLRTCPVWGSGSYSSSFGAYRPGPPVHAHQGNDIMVPYGSPVIAPFDGTAVAGQSVLGGLSVKVFGREGYVYNAHLAAYGKLGDVKLGDIIGFVGNTGNARYTEPHNHFEWHPGNGRAVDPFAFLNEACAS
jgi:murein DD-endopeptidase MepM/ murein hydrolase activator NlpD